MMNWRHNETVGKDIILHDCKVSGARLEEGVLSLDFDEGFWISPLHPESELDTLVRTDGSKMDIYLNEDPHCQILVYVFERRFGKTVRKELPIEKLINDVSAGKARIEFLYQYADWNDEGKRIFDCIIMQDKKPFWRECLIKVYAKEIVYRWNKIEREKVW